MKAADYRIPWGRPSEHLLAVKREIIGQQLHVRRIQDARNRSTIDTEPPECAHMPHLITRPKKKKVRSNESALRLLTDCIITVASGAAGSNSECPTEDVVLVCI